MAETNTLRSMDVAGDDLLYNNNEAESVCASKGIIAHPSILEYDVPNLPLLGLAPKGK